MSNTRGLKLTRPNPAKPGQTRPITGFGQPADRVWAGFAAPRRRTCLAPSMERGHPCPLCGMPTPGRTRMSALQPVTRSAIHREVSALNTYPPPRRGSAREAKHKAPKTQDPPSMERFRPRRAMAGRVGETSQRSSNVPSSKPQLQSRLRSAKAWRLGCPPIGPWTLDFGLSLAIGHWPAAPKLLLSEGGSLDIGHFGASSALPHAPRSPLPASNPPRRPVPPVTNQ